MLVEEGLSTVEVGAASGVGGIAPCTVLLHDDFVVEGELHSLVDIVHQVTRFIRIGKRTNACVHKVALHESTTHDDCAH